MSSSSPHRPTLLFQASDAADKPHWQQHPDLERERSLASFDSRQLTHLLNGSPEKTKRIEALRLILEREPVFERTHAYHVNHEGEYLRALRVMERVRALSDKHRWTDEDMRLVWTDLYEGIPSLLNDDLFIKTLSEQASKEQQDKWLPLAKNWAIFGCYVQTELGHGSNIRGLETTATLIPETDELELNTPTLTSVKWWPGALGKTANVAVVFAQLLLPDKNGQLHQAGVFGFVVQLRSFNDHKWLPGVETGDIGPKIGFNGVDNGYLVLRRVRIPRENMLQKHTQLTRDGRLVATGKRDQRHVYGTMLYARVNIVAGASMALAQASTISIRYSLVRRQFGDKKSHNKNQSQAGPEYQILDYQSQQQRLLIPLSASYAYHFTGLRMLDLYQRMMAAKDNATATELLAESHATSSALKANVTDRTSGDIEKMRRACGGHGYSRLSGLPDLLTTYSQNNTVEGENHVLAQQAARVLLKRFQSLNTASPAPRPTDVSPDYRYMLSIPAGQLEAERCSAVQVDEIIDPAVYVRAHERRAAHQIHHLHRRLEQGAAFSDCLDDVDRIVRAHSELYAVLSFVDALNTQSVLATAPAIQHVLRLLCDLFALSQIVESLGDHLESGYLLANHGPLAREAVRKLLLAIRPDALALVDAFNLSDRQLGSALGRWDGRVYEALASQAQASPMNREEVTSGYEPSTVNGERYKGLKGIIHDGWRRVGRDVLRAKL